MRLVDGTEGELLVGKGLEQGEVDIRKRREGLKNQGSGQ